MNGEIANFDCPRLTLISLWTSADSFCSCQPQVRHVGLSSDDGW